jgi:hypothetical protein
MPGKTTDEKLVEAVANLGERVYALTFNVIELNKALSTMTEKLNAPTERAIIRAVLTRSWFLDRLLAKDTIAAAISSVEGGSGLPSLSTSA